MPIHPLDEIFHPKSIAVTGASGNPRAMGYRFTMCLLEYGYQGKIYPVNPKYEEVLGIKAYPSLKDIPDSIDYVISCVPAAQVLHMLKECPQKGVKAVHLYTARFSETGRQEAIELERKILREAREHNIHLIGPNCLGIHYPREGISFSDAMPKESGTTGLISQSGQASEEIARIAAPRAIYLSKAISYGNALDLNACDFLDYLSRDPETKIILMYIEGVRDGKRFLDSLRQASSVKPVIILKGGRGKSGARAAASHTASLAGSVGMWETMVSQAGAVPAENLEEMIDLAVSFSFLPSITGARVGVAGAGGGGSVLAADQCEEAGLDVVPLSAEFRKELKSNGIPVWDWIGNPADMSIAGDASFGIGETLQMMARYPDFDFLIAILSEPHHKSQQGMTAKNYLDRYKLDGEISKPVLAVAREIGLGIDDYDAWNWKVMCEVRTKLIESGIPCYPTVGRAARAAKKLIDYYQRKD